MVGVTCVVYTGVLISVYTTEVERGTPHMPRDPIRTVRVPDEIWQHAKDCSKASGVSISAYIVRALRRWRVKQ
jgi:hypothetical protein